MCGLRRLSGVEKAAALCKPCNSPQGGDARICISHGHLEKPHAGRFLDELEKGHHLDQIVLETTGLENSRLVCMSLTFSAMAGPSLGLCQAWLIQFR